MLSYWERQSFIAYDFVIIGSGIVGLSAAIHLKERFPGASVLVLERGFFPTGASSRNAGFACMGSVTELLDDLEGASETAVLELYERRKNGLLQLRKRLGDARIGYEENGSYELICLREESALEKIDYLNRLLSPLSKAPAFLLANDKIKSFGFSEDFTRGLIENRGEGELHTGKMLRALTSYALEAGVEIKTGAEVRGFEENEKEVSIRVSDSFRKEEIRLRAGRVLFCTNAFTRQFFPEEDVVPGRGQVLVTYPVHGLKFKGIFHFDKGYYYFREIEGRVLLGGGRNLDFQTETTTELTLNQAIQNDLEEKLREVILPDNSFEIDMRWSGIMGFGRKSKTPVVKAFGDRLFGAFRLGGMGVALGSEVAFRLADLVGEANEG